jgi:hypothetical protein
MSGAHVLARSRRALLVAFFTLLFQLVWNTDSYGAEPDRPGSRASEVVPTACGKNSPTVIRSEYGLTPDCPPCGPLYCIDPAAANSAREAMKARLRAQGYPERLLKLLDRYQCVGCILTAPSAFSIMIEYEPGKGPRDEKGGSTWTHVTEKWSPQDEVLARQKLREGKIKAFYIFNADQACKCCGQKDPWERSDWNAALEVNTDEMLQFKRPQDLGPDPPDLHQTPPSPPNSGPQQTPVSSGEYTKPPRRSVKAKCAECQKFADAFNRIAGYIDDAWQKKIRLQSGIDIGRSVIQNQQNQLAALQQQGPSSDPAVQQQIANLQKDIAGHEQNEREDLAKIQNLDREIAEYSNQLKAAEAALNGCKCPEPTNTAQLPSPKPAPEPPTPKPKPADEPTGSATPPKPTDADISLSDLGAAAAANGLGSKPPDRITVSVNNGGFIVGPPEDTITLPDDDYCPDCSDKRTKAINLSKTRSNNWDSQVATDMAARDYFNCLAEHCPARGAALTIKGYLDTYQMTSGGLVRLSYLQESGLVTTGNNAQNAAGKSVSNSSSSATPTGNIADPAPVGPTSCTATAGNVGVAVTCQGTPNAQFNLRVNLTASGTPPFVLNVGPVPPSTITISPLAPFGTSNAPSVTLGGMTFAGGGNPEDRHLLRILTQGPQNTSGTPFWNSGDFYLAAAFARQLLGYPTVTDTANPAALATPTSTGPVFVPFTTGNTFGFIANLPGADIAIGFTQLRPVAAAPSQSTTQPPWVLFPPVIPVPTPSASGVNGLVNTTAYPVTVSPDGRTFHLDVSYPNALASQINVLNLPSFAPAIGFPEPVLSNKLKYGSGYRRFTDVECSPRDQSSVSYMPSDTSNNGFGVTPVVRLNFTLGPNGATVVQPPGTFSLFTIGMPPPDASVKLTFDPPVINPQLVDLIDPHAVAIQGTPAGRHSFDFKLRYSLDKPFGSHLFYFPGIGAYTSSAGAPQLKPHITVEGLNGVSINPPVYIYAYNLTVAQQLGSPGSTAGYANPSKHGFDEGPSRYPAATTVTPSAASSALTCVTNVTVTPALRAEGLTELTGDIVLNCSGAPTGSLAGDIFLTFSGAPTAGSGATGQFTPTVTNPGQIQFRSPFNLAIPPISGTQTGPNTVRFTIPLSPGQAPSQPDQPTQGVLDITGVHVTLPSVGQNLQVTFSGSPGFAFNPSWLTIPSVVATGGGPEGNAITPNSPAGVSVPASHHATEDTAPKSNPRPYLQFEFKDVLVTNIATSNSPETSNETVTIDYSKIEYNYPAKPVKRTGQKVALEGLEAEVAMRSPSVEDGSDASLHLPLPGRDGSRRRANPYVQLAAFHSGDALKALPPGTLVRLVPRAHSNPPVAAHHAPQTPAQAAVPIAFSLVANGNSSGEAFELRVADPSGKLREIRAPDGLIVEPLERDSAKPVSAAPGKKLVSHKLNAYCVDYAKDPPEPDAIYRVAAPDIQEQYKPIRMVMRAGRELAAAGKFHPDTDALAYNISIRQYALWTKLENWNEEKFGEVFLEKTRKIAADSKVEWNKEMDQALRALIPGRWRDISMVLEQARKLEAASQAAGAPPAPAR